MNAQRLKQPNVLYYENNPHILNTCSNILSGLGLNVFELRYLKEIHNYRNDHSVKAAILRNKSYAPAGESGIDEAIRSRREDPTIPVIIFTGSDPKDFGGLIPENERLAAGIQIFHNDEYLPALLYVALRARHPEESVGFTREAFYSSLGFQPDAYGNIFREDLENKSWDLIYNIWNTQDYSKLNELLQTWRNSREGGALHTIER